MNYLYNVVAKVGSHLQYFSDLQLITILNYICLMSKMVI